MAFTFKLRCYIKEGIFRVPDAWDEQLTPQHQNLKSTLVHLGSGVKRQLRPHQQQQLPPPSRDLPPELNSPEAAALPEALPLTPPRDVMYASPAAAAAATATGAAPASAAATSAATAGTAATAAPAASAAAATSRAAASRTPTSSGRGQGRVDWRGRAIGGAGTR
jgi:hypothetical protein